MSRPPSSDDHVRRSGRRVLRSSVAFLVAFGCVELYAVVEAASSEWRGQSIGF